MTKFELAKNRLVFRLIDQGQSPYNIDMKCKAKFRPRKCHKTQIMNRDVFCGRMYSDFLLLAPDCIERATEMDTVHSSRNSEKVLLTFYLGKERLFLAFLMNRCTDSAVRMIFDRLKNRLGTDFPLLFHTILTDRGLEFRDHGSLETGIYGEKCSSIFYCAL